MTGRVYFVKCGERIKIGFSGDVKGRLQSLKTAAPDGLEFIGAVPGDTRLESAIHRHLAEHRKNGEWFDDCEPVREVLVRLQTEGSEFLDHLIRPKPAAQEQTVVVKVDPQPDPWDGFYKRVRGINAALDSTITRYHALCDLGVPKAELLKTFGDLKAAFAANEMALERMCDLEDRLTSENSDELTPLANALIAQAEGALAKALASLSSIDMTRTPK